MTYIFAKKKRGNYVSKFVAISNLVSLCCLFPGPWFPDWSLVRVFRGCQFRQYCCVPEGIHFGTIFSHKLVSALILSIEMPFGVHITKSHQSFGNGQNALNLIEIIVCLFQ